MNEYLTKHPKEKESINVLLFAFGIDKTNEICREAVELEKKIEVTNDLELLDLVNYSFI